MTDKPSSHYDPENLVHIQPVDMIRRRPLTWIGGTDQSGLHNLLNKLLQELCFDFHEQFLSRIELTLYPNRIIVIEADGHCTFDWKKDRFNRDLYDLLLTGMTTPGIPRQPLRDRILHTPAFIDYSYISATALSETLMFDLCKNGEHLRWIYHQGVCEAPLMRVDAVAQDQKLFRLTFKPDWTIFESVEPDYQRLCNRAEILAACFQGVTISVSDQRIGTDESHSFHFENGLAGYLETQNASHTVLHAPFHFRQRIPYPYHWGQGEMLVDVSLQYCEHDEGSINLYANGEPCSIGGYHWDGFCAGLTAFFQLDMAVLNNGLRAIVNVIHPYLSWDCCGMEPTHMINTELFEQTRMTVYSGLRKLSQDPAYDEIFARIRDHLNSPVLE